MAVTVCLALFVFLRVFFRCCFYVNGLISMFLFTKASQCECNGISALLVAVLASSADSVISII